MSGIRLVTRADDAGMNGSANRAIRHSIREGIVRNVSLMAPAPAIKGAFDLLGEMQSEIDFGLHVTLTAEWNNLRWGAVAGDSVSSLLLPDGTFPYDCDELASLAPDLDEMMAEVIAQYDLLADIGFQISYLDEHMVVGQVAGLHDRLAEFAEEHGLIYNRALFENGAIARLPGWNGPGEHPGTELADHLAGVAPGTYLIVGHPTGKDEEMQEMRLPDQAAGEAAVDRNRQRRMFMDIEIIDYCENVGIELLRYSDV
ncbi:MAG: ChbG/HpnK family deacetylase [Spirochaetales bacterium]|nr:MAG: ChbG/HpnK family deacetylase [Spirochaetales bacterium]